MSVTNCDEMDNAGPLLTDLIVGFLAGACIPRKIWRVLVWFALPLIIAILVVHPNAGVSEEEEEGQRIVVFVLTLGGFIATGAGLVIGALLRAFIKRNLPKAHSGTNSQDAMEAPPNRKD